jgi:lysophospholipase L1-like esterase
MEHQLSKKKVLAFSGVAVVLALVLIEIGLRVAGGLIGDANDPRESFSCYQGQPWAEAMFQDYREQSKLEPEYQRFVTWGDHELTSEYVNVLSDGRRKTWEPPVDDRPVKTIYMLGGSTMFGSGSPDDGTIPSYVSQDLNANASSAFRYVVENYGQGGYTFAQEAVQLSLLLREGKRPDYVLFYDGGNDVTAAYDAGEAGALITEPLLREKFEATEWGRIVLGVEEVIKNECRTCRALINIARTFSPGNLRLYPIQGLGYGNEQFASLADGIIQEYANTLDLVDALSRAYGFEYHTFWQPSLFGDKLVGDEQKLPNIDWRLADEKQAALFAAVRDRLDRIDSPHFTDLSDALRDRSEQVFLDNVHVCEQGNSAIAGKMVEQMAGQLEPHE